MKFTTLPCILAVASYAVADAIAEPELVQAQHLENRQGAAVVAPAATQAAVQYPSITTQWIESTIGSSATYVQVIYTQQFSAVPDQLPTAVPGAIGLGTLTKHGKRDMPIETGIAGRIRPIVIEVLEEVVTQWVQAVEEVMVLHTVFVLDNATLHGINGNSTFGNWTLGNSTLGNGTYSNGTYIGVNGTDYNTTTTNTTSTTATNTTASSSSAIVPGFSFSF
ncbi:hypothetical protein LTR86_008552 [Recurvomyces mirabilis]|nr:hypothetical protein LTR86_008552 [Recurvomyces mirabilis]